MVKKKITIIGSGEIGRALGGVLRINKNNSVDIWARKPSRGTSRKPLADLVFSADFLFLCVPSWAVREIISGIKSQIQKNTVVVCLAKGIDGKGKKTMDSVLKESLPRGQEFSILAGPMIAEELQKGMGGRGIAGVSDKKTFFKILTVFEKTGIKLEFSDDLRGAALAGVLKNIYALALGIADGFGWGGNMKSMLVVKAMEEMAAINKILGGKQETIFGAAGYGDFIATGFSHYSRNRESGEDFVKTGKCCLKSEGIISLPPLVSLLGGKMDKLPLLSALYSVIVGGKNLKKTFQSLI